MIKNTGTEAQDLFEALVKREGGYSFRLRDKKDVMGLNKGKRVAMFPCPADFLIISPEGLMGLAEVKSTHNKTSFSYDGIRPAQRSAAGICAALDAPYMFFILDMNTKQWYYLPAETFAADLKAGKKSRKYTELESFVH